jgi:hypothetical protein
MNKPGFYKAENNELFYGPNYVLGINSENLYKENKDSYEFPINGWYWFDTEEEARIALNVPVPPPPPIFVPPVPPLPPLLEI